MILNPHVLQVELGGRAWFDDDVANQIAGIEAEGAAVRSARALDRDVHRKQPLGAAQRRAEILAHELRFPEIEAGACLPLLHVGRALAARAGVPGAPLAGVWQL